jgi:hypothetical protein
MSLIIANTFKSLAVAAVLCAEIKEVALGKPLSLGHLVFCLSVLFFFRIILRFNF